MGSFPKKGSNALGSESKELQEEALGGVDECHAGYLELVETSMVSRGLERLYMLYLSCSRIVVYIKFPV